jgi:hypothetical protein
LPTAAADIAGAIMLVIGAIQGKEHADYRVCHSVLDRSFAGQNRLLFLTLAFAFSGLIACAKLCRSDHLINNRHHFRWRESSQ